MTDIDFRRENEGNKRKLQQIQKKWEESEAKEQAHWRKLQEYTHLFEQSQFEKNEVRIILQRSRFKQSSRFLFQAIVERDQTKIELTETQKRLSKLIDEMTEKIGEEKKRVENLCEIQMKENAEKVRNDNGLRREVDQPLDDDLAPTNRGTMCSV